MYSAILVNVFEASLLATVAQLLKKMLPAALLSIDKKVFALQSISTPQSISK